MCKREDFMTLSAHVNMSKRFGMVPWKSTY